MAAMVVVIFSALRYRQFRPTLVLQRVLLCSSDIWLRKAWIIIRPRAQLYYTHCQVCILWSRDGTDGRADAQLGSLKRHSWQVIWQNQLDSRIRFKLWAAIPSPSFSPPLIFRCF